MPASTTLFSPKGPTACGHQPLVEKSPFASPTPCTTLAVAPEHSGSRWEGMHVGRAGPVGKENSYQSPSQSES